MLFDSHAHYNDSRFSDDVHDILSVMQENNVSYIMNACSSMDEIPYILELAEQYDFLYASVGVHPHEAEYITDKDIELLEDYAKHPKVKAIGEIGLDYYYDNSPRELQQKWFSSQIELAQKLDMPIIIHDRDAHRDCLDILNQYRGVHGVFHCYSGSAEMLDEVLDLGLYVAFGGTLTFKKAQRPVEAAKAAPLDKILIETDCPYLAPEPNRGKRNSSLYIHYVAEKLAEIKNMSVSEIEKITLENAKKCFRIE